MNAAEVSQFSHLKLFFMFFHATIYFFTLLNYISKLYKIMFTISFFIFSGIIMVCKLFSESQKVKTVYIFYLKSCAYLF